MVFLVEQLSVPANLVFGHLLPVFSWSSMKKPFTAQKLFLSEVSVHNSMQTILQFEANRSSQVSVHNSMQTGTVHCVSLMELSGSR